ncbi:hypothetical protein K2Z83_13275 [Oscillochloris sp. ZM17-4]|uniref:hypothetical protein n=1 Tax=Oscillochloris sp. ZM17-4 TaxID=2866714 RepID=UPI001C7315D9|nr:hypothetical protein [Oscillochloris sp. ZM17-4]MBX0328648.1 hypothetical protein [Oscillochloris sp. ZM17-4]
MERPSPLTQRVRRLLGTHELVERPATMVRPLLSVPNDTSALFESQLSQLSASLAELRAADRRRDAELRALRAIVRDADDRARSLGMALTEIDELLRAGRALLDPAEEPDQPTTLFERMRARIGGTNRLEPRQREVLAELLARMAGVREQIRSCLIIDPRQL